MMFTTEVPTKDEDDMGQATPRMVVGALHQGASPSEEQQKPDTAASYSSISKKNLEAKLKNE